MPTLALLAGGLATRLRPLTEKIPKAMIEIANEPFVAHQLRLLRRQSVARVVICAGFLGERIAAYVGDGGRFGIAVEYSYDGPKLLGTGGALLKALPRLGDAFLVMHGDSYLDTPFASIVARFRSAGTLGLMTVFRNEGLWDRSNVEFEDGRIRRYDKVSSTATMRHIDYGLGMLSARAFEAKRQGEPFDLADLYGELLARGELAGYEVHERFYEIGSASGIVETNRYLRSRD